MTSKFLWFSLALVVLYQAPIWALKEKTTIVKPKVFYKEKRYTFTPADFEKCGQSMKRREGSLYYTCTLEITHQSDITHLKEQVSSNRVTVRFGGTDKTVYMQVTDNASFVIFSTEFDDTGVDYEITGFNPEFFRVYSKVAQLVMAEAMTKEPLRITYLETK